MEEQPSTAIEKFVIPHQAFANALDQIQQAFRYARHKVDAEALAIIGESGTGKSSVLKLVLSENQPYRDAKGLKTPILFASVPEVPTRKSLASELLAAIGDPEPDRGTAPMLTRRLIKHIEESGTCMIMVDEFQHFFDRDKHKFMYDVADWLKRLIDLTNITLIVAGLPTCMGVIDQNEQLARRFQERIELPRFCWTNISQREQFIKILRCYERQMGKEYEIPSLSSEAMAFRFYCGTGGLIGYLSALLKKMLRNAESASEKTISLGDIALAYSQSTWRSSNVPNPFSSSFELTESEETLKNVTKIGTAFDEPTFSCRVRPRKPPRSSINARLRVAS